MDSEPIRKRRKALMACEYCRAKKTKCDGERPICGSCAHRGWTAKQCVWKFANGEEALPSGPLVDDLQRRIVELEKQARSTASRSPSGVSPLSSAIVRRSSISNPSESYSTKPPTVSALEGAVTGEQQNEGFIGAGSTAAFMHAVRYVVDPVGASSSARPTFTQIAEPAGPVDYVLPSRREANALLQMYWAYVHPIYPFLHKPTFDTSYQALWTGEPFPELRTALMSEGEANSVAAVNLVMALACQYTRNEAAVEATRYAPKLAELYYGRAREIWISSRQKNGADTLQSVQVVLLMAQYLQSVGNIHRAWETIGIGIRSCYRLGLHRAATFSDNADLRAPDHEMVKRVWHGCLLIERMLSTTLGRPAMIVPPSRGFMPLPSEVDEDAFQSSDDTLEYNHSNTMCAHSLITFFILSVELYEIAEEYSARFNTDDLPVFSANLNDFFSGDRSILHFDARMTSWYDGIPRHLDFDYARHSPLDTDGRISRFYRQAVILRLRYLQKRIYLFKPVLSHVCAASKGQGRANLDNNIAWRTGRLLQRTAVQCSLICVRVAIDLIETMHVHITSAQTWGQKPAWLYAVLHMYLAATVLLAARLVPGLLLAETSLQEVQAAWDHALSILTSFQADSISANKCVAALQLLYRKLPATPRAPSEQRDTDDGARNWAVEDQAASHPQINPAVQQGPHLFFQDVEGMSLPEDTTDWLQQFDLSDPYDMSWFSGLEMNLT